jgi:predicted RNA-binding protein YlxR (DUF448 family)
MRTCTGCRTIAPQGELVRLAFDGPRLVIDPTSCVHNANPSQRGHRLPGRGAYVHANVACVTAAGLSRSFRRRLVAADISRVVAEMSPSHDNLGAKYLASCPADGPDEPLQNASQNAPGHEDGDTVEMPPRIKAKDDRSEDARL